MKIIEPNRNSINVGRLSFIKIEQTSYLLKDNVAVEEGRFKSKIVSSKMAVMKR